MPKARRFWLAITVGVLLFLGTARAGEAGGPRSTAAYDLDQHALFRAIGDMYDLDPELLEAVAEVESAGHPDAVSPKGAIGLMQLMPATAARYHVRDPRDPVENALGSARYLAHLRAAVPSDHEGYELSRILAAYNAGEGAVLRYDGLPPYSETQRYVGRVLWIYLTGTPFPRQSHMQQVSEQRVRPSGQPRHGDREVLDQLDSLRRARESALASDSEHHPSNLDDSGSNHR